MRKRFGGLDPSQAAELRRLQHENARLKTLVAERDLDIEILKVSRGLAGGSGSGPVTDGQVPAAARFFHFSKKAWSKLHRQWLRGLNFEHRADQAVFGDYLLAISSSSRIGYERSRGNPARRPSRILRSHSGYGIP